MLKLDSEENKLLWTANNKLGGGARAGEVAGGKVVDGEEQSQGKTQKAATKTGTVSCLLSASLFSLLSLSFPSPPKFSPHTYRKRRPEARLGQT